MQTAKQPQSETHGAPNSDSDGKQSQHKMFQGVERPKDQQGQAQRRANADERDIPNDCLLGSCGKADRRRTNHIETGPRLLKSTDPLAPLRFEPFLRFGGKWVDREVRNNDVIHVTTVLHG